jgi:spoIIIJ-associated protein
MSGTDRVEATGETVGEARWAALRELERRHPDLRRDAVEFVVVSEGQRGLLGVGYEPARVIATAPASAAPPPTTAVAHDDEPAAGAVRELVERVVEACGLRATVALDDDGERVTARLSGEDLGLFIGRHGHTIDALQYLANVIVRRLGDGAVREVVVDAHGYRERRERALQEVAARATEEVRRSGRPVALEPMTSVERKIVHLALEHVPGIATASEGSEPNRHVVVLPEPVSGQV